MILCTIKDQQSNSYQNLFSMQNEIEAKRQFINIISGGGSMIADFPEDFAMVKLGDYEPVDRSAKIHEERVLLTGSQVVQMLSEKRAASVEAEVKDLSTVTAKDVKNLKEKLQKELGKKKVAKTDDVQ
jgi:hypothetical protein